MIETDGARLEPRLREQTQPVGAREEAFDVPIMLGAHRSVRQAHQVRVVSEVGRVRRIRIPGPRQPAERARVAVVTAMIGGRLKRFADGIGGEERGASRLAVHERRLDCLSQIRFARHVGHRVVNKDGVELPSQPDRAHVPLHLLAFRIQRAADRKHPG